MGIEAYANSWAQVACQVLQTHYPYAAAHLSLSEADHDVAPRTLHPAFHGALDWHSSVHMQWSLLKLLTLAKPELVADGTAEQICQLLDRRLTKPAIETEIRYLQRYPAFERPYGWAWAAMLATTAWNTTLPEDDEWAEAIAPLIDVIADKVLHWLPRQAYPVRHGVHSNSAFALSLMHEAFSSVDRERVVTAIDQRAREWFGDDHDADTHLEPSGTDFLSPSLCEAELMRRVLGPADFAEWLDRFLPKLGDGAHGSLLEVPTILDPTDGHFVHLAGLALSRSWQLRNLARLWQPEDLRTRVVLEAADTQFEAARPLITDGDFMSTHWLVSFALLAELSA